MRLVINLVFQSDWIDVHFFPEEYEMRDVLDFIKNGPNRYDISVVEHHPYPGPVEDISKMWQGSKADMKLLLAMMKLPDDTSMPLIHRAEQRSQELLYQQRHMQQEMQHQAIQDRLELEQAKLRMYADIQRALHKAQE